MDTLRRVLKYNGYKLNHAMNITDVGHLTSDADEGEDKMAKSAREQNKSVYEIAKMYTEAYQNDFKKLNIEDTEVLAKATDHIKDMEEYVKEIIKNGYGYETSKGVYFDTSKLENYGRMLSNNKIEDLKDGARIEVDKEKRNPQDSAIWIKAPKEHIMKWDSFMGLCYPGWHIECSAISIKKLGEYLDIHCGGVDNIFPHHTNEIAQSEAYLGHKWCNYWFHNEHLNDESGKMSKSSGAILTVSVLQDKGYNPLSYRFMCLMSHYRKQLVFSYDSLDGAENAFKKLLNKTRSLNKSEEYDQNEFRLWDQKFRAYLEDDLNVANTITLLYEMLKSDTDEGVKYALVEAWDNVLALDLLSKRKIANEEEVLFLIEKRNEAKKNKDYAAADQIREELLSKGIVLKDTREGTVYEVK